MSEKWSKRRKEIGTNSDDGGGGESLQENREESSQQSKLSVLRLLSEQVSYNLQYSTVMSFYCDTLGNQHKSAALKGAGRKRVCMAFSVCHNHIQKKPFFSK